LDLTKSIDQAVEERLKQARSNLQKVLNAPNITETIKQNLPAVDDFFLQAMADELETARKAGDMGRIEKIRQIEAVLQQASAPSKEVELIEKLLSAEGEREQKRLLEENRKELTPEFMEALSYIMAKFQSSEDKEMAGRLETLYRVVLRFSSK
jgi:hypothetical protein